MKGHVKPRQDSVSGVPKIQCKTRDCETAKSMEWPEGAPVQLIGLEFQGSGAELSITLFPNLHYFRKCCFRILQFLRDTRRVKGGLTETVTSNCGLEG